MIFADVQYSVLYFWCSSTRTEVLFLYEQTQNAIDDCFCRVCVLSELCGGVYANIYEIKMFFQRCTD